MATEANELQKREALHPAVAERTRMRKVFLPVVDIYETKDGTVLIADLPGADEKSVGITLEKNVLTITAEVETEDYKGYSASLIEYDTGDYQRSFTISDEVDQENIKATMKNGVIRVTLQKTDKAKLKKITIKNE
jgi:HSP20 family molecular chaperone IbpA